MSKTPGTVTVWVKIPWTEQMADEPISLQVLEARAREWFDRGLDAGNPKCSLAYDGFDLANIEIDSEFVADQDPGGEG